MPVYAHKRAHPQTLDDSEPTGLKRRVILELHEVQSSATNLLPEIGNPSAKPTDLQATRAARLLEMKVQTTPY